MSKEFRAVPHINEKKQEIYFSLSKLCYIQISINPEGGGSVWLQDVSTDE